MNLPAEVAAEIERGPFWVAGKWNGSVVDWATRIALLAAAAQAEADAKICDGYANGRQANMADLCAEDIRAQAALAQKQHD